MFVGDDVTRVAVIRAAEQRGLGEDRARDGDIDAAATGDAVVLAIAHLAIAARRHPRRLEVDHHRATGRVAAEQSALRSAQHLDLVDVEEAEIGCILSGDVDVVDIGADCRIEGGNRAGAAKATNIIGSRRAQAWIVSPAHVGNQLRYLGRRSDLEGLEVAWGDRGNGHRNILQPLRAALRGDVHRLQAVVGDRVSCRGVRAGCLVLPTFSRSSRDGMCRWRIRMFKPRVCGLRECGGGGAQCREGYGSQQQGETCHGGS